MKNFEQFLKKRIDEIKTEINWRKKKEATISKGLVNYFGSEEMKLIKELLELTNTNIYIISDSLAGQSVTLSIKSDLSFEYSNVSLGLKINKNKVPKITEVAEIIKKHRPNWEIEDIIKAIREGAKKA